ncbi:MAG: DUF2490 domain-containing protein [Cyclobacteriaceae bacterium]|nr:DUF2490 domain-containing protein [Cyclobacteriaceae bacterium]
MGKLNLFKATQTKATKGGNTVRLGNKMKVNKLLVIILVSLPFSAFSQDSDIGNWLLYFGNKNISKKLNWHHEVQYRNYNAIGDLEQLLLRTGLGYNLSEKNNNLLLGYGFIRSENYLTGTTEKQIVNEHRIYQQFINKHKISRLYLQHRFRFEQRFVEDAFKMRFRYFLAFNIPLTNPTMEDKTVYLSAYNEIFLNTEGDIFDRNRLYGGLGYKVNKTVRFELGYMNQFFSEGGRDQLNMVVFVNLPDKSN